MLLSIETVIIGLFLISIILLIFSFFKKDKYTDLENQVENLTMMVMKETYQLKKRIKILEEELLQSDSYTVPFNNPYTQEDKKEEL